MSVWCWHKLSEPIVCFSVWLSLEKEDFFENLHVLSCFVRLKSILFNLLYVLDLVRVKWNSHTHTRHYSGTPVERPPCGEITPLFRPLNLKPFSCYYQGNEPITKSHCSFQIASPWNLGWSWMRRSTVPLHWYQFWLATVSSGENMGLMLTKRAENKIYHPA